MTATLDPSQSTDTLTHAMARFAVVTEFTDLPAEVVDYTKLLILDSLICGIGASQAERTQMSHKLAERLGGPAEATVFGMDTQVPSSLAASINSEIMNYLDADDTFFNTAHFVVLNVAAALAEAERVGGSGKDLIRAVAVGFDLSARANLAGEILTFENNEFKWASLQGSGYASLGAAASGGIVSGLDSEQMANALALVTGTAPTARNAGMATRREFASFKYAPYFHLGQTAMTALLMAELGYVGEHEDFDIQPGFLEGQGFLKSDVSKLHNKLGEQWWILDSAIKYTPACRYTSAPALALRRFMDQNDLTPEDIESIEVRLNPAAYSMSLFSNPETNFSYNHVAPFKAQFNIPFVLAQMALGRIPGPDWYTEEAITDPQVWDFAQRITTAPDPSLNEEWNSQINQSTEGRPRRTRGSLTIQTADRELVVESDFAPGDPWSDETRPTWDTVGTKFRNFCGGIMSNEQIKAITDVVRDLENIADISAALTPLLLRTAQR